jgi:hypothetical protein
MGATVLNPQSQNLGRLKDVLLDAQTGQASFAILDAEIPGAGHAMLVVPYDALRVSVNPSDHRQSVVLDLRPEQLRAAPQTGSDEAKMIQNPQFLAQARNFYQGTYTVARPIDKPSLPSPPALPAAPRPSARIADWSGWPQNLVDLYNE